MKLQKETKGHGKWYDDACGTAFAMELVGERWSLLVIRELMLGPRRFTDLRASLPGISAKVLTERLAGLEEAGVLNRRKLPPPVSAQVYELTEWGYRAEPLVQELGRWAAMSSRHDPTLPLSPVSLMLSMRTMFDPVRAAGLQATIGFDIAGETFVARMANGALPIKRADPGIAEAVFRAPGAPVLAGLLYGGVGADELERDAGLVIEGDRDLALAYADIFELPAPIA
ncbi:winged helix-turn-helix transcriptional regulator [Qipengyuania sp. SS22]|uniref:winged helix-turn-helix transcriptional regulator n=1 Tax=Qipengyuania sp. SS22 TaxID=2979461 RepID=UPI0021E5C4D1|nr:winged helix-turn-helix transcriptional regulator [Qipengyuania sp. SS22]UYH55379.1 winged helix-turn-helix transcriptional regulator [Qipengyuania sp. SS22]